MENPFVKLFAIDFKDHVEVKKSGNTELKYVSWAYAWAEVKKLYPAASYEVKKFNGLPYVYDPITGFMVYTSVTIEGISHEMWLPVLDGANKAMKAVPYTYTTPKQEQPPMPCICVRCNQPIKRVKLKDGSIMQAAELAATHDGMCADCYKATRLNVA